METARVLELLRKDELPVLGWADAQMPSLDQLIGESTVNAGYVFKREVRVLTALSEVFVARLLWETQLP